MIKQTSSAVLGVFSASVLTASFRVLVFVPCVVSSHKVQHFVLLSGGDSYFSLPPPLLLSKSFAHI